MLAYMILKGNGRSIRMHVIKINSYIELAFWIPFEQLYLSKRNMAVIQDRNSRTPIFCILVFNVKGLLLSQNSMGNQIYHLFYGTVGGLKAHFLVMAPALTLLPIKTRGACQLLEDFFASPTVLISEIVFVLLHEVEIHFFLLYRPIPSFSFGVSVCIYGLRVICKHYTFRIFFLLAGLEVSSFLLLVRHH